MKTTRATKPAPLKDADSAMSAKARKASILIARLPADLMQQIDATAQKCGRTRSSETRMRLEESFKRLPIIATTGAAVATPQ